MIPYRHEMCRRDAKKLQLMGLKVRSFLCIKNLAVGCPCAQG